MTDTPKDQCFPGDHRGDHTYITYDARGIPLGKVCSECVDKVRGTYRADVLTDPHYPSDEPIEPDDPVGPAGRDDGYYDDGYYN